MTQSGHRVHIPHKSQQRQATVRGRAPDDFSKCLRRLRCKLSVRNVSRNACFRCSLCPYRPPTFSSIYSSNFRRATGGRFGDDRIRLMTMAVGPARLSKLSNAQAVLRPTPRTAACLAVVSHPAAINASRISSSFEACLPFARRSFLVPRIVRPHHHLSSAPKDRPFGDVLLNNGTHAWRQLGICEHAVDGVGI